MVEGLATNGINRFNMNGFDRFTASGFGRFNTNGINRLAFMKSPNRHRG